MMHAGVRSISFRMNGTNVNTYLDIKRTRRNFTMTAMKGKPIGAAVATMIATAVAATGRGMTNSV